jgi:Outer membrane protein beta-barrel domain
MHKLTKWIPCALVMVSAIAWSQEYPKAETSFDYSYVRYAPNFPGSQGHNLNGGGGTFVFNLNRYLGIKADLQGYGSTTSHFSFAPSPVFPLGVTGNAQGNLFTYLFGPQIKIHSPKIQPFVHLLFGGAHSNIYANAFSAVCRPGSGVCAVSRAPSNDAFSMAFGGGIDIPLGHKVSIRPAGLDYLYTDFTNRFNNSNQNNFRYTAGINFNLGGRGQ